MTLYAISGFFLGDIFAGLNTVTNGVSYWASNLPYLIYPILLLATPLAGRKRFTAQGQCLASAPSQRGERFSRATLHAGHAMWSYASPPAFAGALCAM
jgi:hypothetical protein